MQALVLERAQQLSLRELAVAERLGPHDVRAAVCPRQRPPRCTSRQVMCDLGAGSDRQVKLHSG